MQTNQIYYFLAVCEQGSFSKAANTVFVTQPTLSRQIAALEEEIGLQLLERHRNGRVTLTSAGLDYLQTFRGIVQSLEEASLRTRFRKTKKRCRYRIGLVEGWMLQDLIRRAAELAEKEFPDVELSFEFYPESQLSTLCLDEQLDLCLTKGYDGQAAGGYTQELLTELPGALYVSRNNRHIQNGDVRIADLHEEKFYALPLGRSPRASAKLLFQIMGSEKLVIQEQPNLFSIHMGVLSGNGYSLADTWAEAVHDPRFFVKPLPDIPTAIVLNRKKQDDSMLTKALSACIRIWAANPEMCF